MNQSKLQQPERDRLTRSLRFSEGKGAVHIESRLNTSIGNVWAAFVDPERLARWLGRFEGQL